MDFEIDLRESPARARLIDPDDLRSFRVVLLESGDPLPARLEAAGVARLDEHAWIRIDTLRQLAGTDASPEWERGFDAMIEFARSRGWVDDELGAVRGHVERPGRP